MSKNTEWPCKNCGKDDFTFVVVNIAPNRQDMILTCVNCKHQCRLVNVTLESIDPGYTVADGEIITDVTTLKYDKENNG